MTDLKAQLDCVRGYSPAAATTDTTPIVSQIVDLEGSNGALIIVATGAQTDINATFDLKIEEGNDGALGDAANVALAQLVSGGEVTANPMTSYLNYADDNEVHTIGYIGNKRYLRVTITPAASHDSGNAFFTIVVAKGGLRKQS
jgi:hypothetical protein